MTDADLKSEPKWVVRRQQLLAQKADVDRAVLRTAAGVAAYLEELEVRSKEIEALCQDIQLEDGEPSWSEVIVMLGHFGAWSQNAEQRCEEIMLGVKDPDPDAIEFSDTIEGYAASFLQSAEITRHYIADGDADAAAACAFRAGMSWATLNLEPVSVRGRKLLESARQGHQAVHGDETSKMALWIAMHRDYVALVAKGTKKTAAAALVAEKYGVCDRTVRDSRKNISKRKSLESPATFQDDMRHGASQQITEE